MDRKKLEQTKSGILTDFKGHKKLLLSFGGIQQGIGIPLFEFFNSIAEIPCDKIFLRDFNQAWYQMGVDENIDHIDKLVEHLQSLIVQNQYERVVVLGNSMGGHAALLFGALLEVDVVLSFVPVTSIDKFDRWRYKDDRVPESINRVHTYKDKRKAYFDMKTLLSKRKNLKTQFNIYYDRNFPVDRKHAERMKKFSNVHLHPEEEGEHGLVKLIRDRGDLQKIIRAAFDE